MIVSDGTIVTLDTVAASIKGVPNRAGYSIGKLAVIGIINGGWTA